MSTEFKELIAVVPLKELLRQLWLNVTHVIINNCQFVNYNKKKLSMLNEKRCLAIRRKAEWLERKKIPFKLNYLNNDLRFQ